MILHVRRAAVLTVVSVLLLCRIAAQSPSLSVLGSIETGDANVVYDESIAVGPTSLITTSNDTVSIRRKSGEVIATSRLSDVFRSVYSKGEVGAFDPRIHFDEGSGHFFMLATTTTCFSSPVADPSACRSHLLFAVSKTGIPASLGASDWFFSAYDASLDNATPTNRWADFPGLGINNEFVVVTMQVFPFGREETAPNKVQKIRVFSKAILLSGATASWVDFSGILDPSTGRKIQAALQPALHFGGSGPLFIVGRAETACQGYVVIGIQSGSQGPVMTSRFVGSTLPCGPEQPPAAQPGGDPLVSFSGLRASPVFRNGSLWITRGVGQTMASGPRPGIRLSQLDVSRWPATPTFVQDAVFAEDGVGRHYPTLTVDGSNNVAILFGRSSAAEYLSLYATGRLGADAPNTLRPPVRFQAGDGPLVQLGTDPEAAGIGGLRFADYYGAALDPADGTVWFVGEYGKSAAQRGFARSIGHLAFPQATIVSPTLSLQLNAPGYKTRDTMILTATMTAGSRAASVDAYVVVRTPEGQSLSLRLDGSIVPGLVPIATGFVPFQFTGDLVHLPFGTPIPAGRYSWQAYFTEPGTTTVVGVMNEVPFTFTP